MLKYKTKVLYGSILLKFSVKLHNLVPSSHFCGTKKISKVLVKILYISKKKRKTILIFCDLSCLDMFKGIMRSIFFYKKKIKFIEILFMNYNIHLTTP